MLPDAIADRIIRSRQTIHGWEQLGLPGGRPEDSARMIREEIAELERIIAAHGHEATLRLLIGKYQAMLVKVEAAKAN